MLTERTLIISQGSLPTWMSISNAAVELGTSDQTIRRYLKKKILDGQKFGRTWRVRTSSVYRARTQVAE
jgi:excisionase family DNA binding protein